MPRNVVFFIGTEHRVDVVGNTDGDVEEFAFAGGLIIRDRAFDEVPGAIGLVHVLLFGPTQVEGLVDGVEGVEIAIGLLGSGDFVDDTIDCFFQLRIALLRERVSRAFDHFVNVRVIEESAFEFPRHQTASLGKVVDPPFAILQIVRHNLLATHLDARRPELAVDLDIGERDGHESDCFAAKQVSATKSVVTAVTQALTVASLVFMALCRYFSRFDEQFRNKNLFKANSGSNAVYRMPRSGGGW